MDLTSTLAALAALSQETRLTAFRNLVRNEPEGVAAGELARQLDIPQNTLSAHLAVLSRAGLVTHKRNGRSIAYRADLERLHAAILFLLKDCCGGRAEICAPLVAALTPSCPSQDLHS